MTVMLPPRAVPELPEGATPPRRGRQPDRRGRHRRRQAIQPDKGNIVGFASTAPGNLLTVDDERRKLELVVETARKVWA
jgi:hypothetical protein